MKPTPLLALALTLLLAPPVLARDALGMFETWGAFRDSAVPRCYAITMAEKRHENSRPESQAYADIASWPTRGIRGQVHLHLSRPLVPGARASLFIADQRFALVTAGTEAWAADRRMDAAVVAAMRSASRMEVSARAASGRAFTDAYPLAGAASAMDAALLGCAGTR